MSTPSQKPYSHAHWAKLAERAEQQGDYAQARALSARVREGQKPSKPTDKKVQQPLAALVAAAGDREARLQADPVALRVGFLALLAYIGAWIYALCANR